VKVLVKLHPEGIETTNKHGKLPIHYMGSHHNDEAGDQSLCRAQEFILKEYPEGSKIQNKYGELPIHCAANRGHLSTAQLLLEEYPEASKVEDEESSLPTSLSLLHK
jgi:ankyrin repeat protein